MPGLPVAAGSRKGRREGREGKKQTGLKGSQLGTSKGGQSNVKRAVRTIPTIGLDNHHIQHSAVGVVQAP